jgi:hypothetical protein
MKIPSLAAVNQCGTGRFKSFQIRTSTAAVIDRAFLSLMLHGRMPRELHLISGA